MTTTTHYSKAMYKYGILTILIVLRRLEQEEQYEECDKIVTMIKDEERKLVQQGGINFKLWTRYTDELAKEITSESSVALSEYERYAYNLYQEVKSLNSVPV